MKFKLSKNQYQFLIALSGVSGFIVESEVEDDTVIFEVSNTSDFQDEIYFNVVEDGMDKEGKVNSLGKQIYNIYDILLSQI